MRLHVYAPRWGQFCLAVAAAYLTVCQCSATTPAPGPHCALAVRWNLKQAIFVHLNVVPKYIEVVLVISRVGWA
jgi:hypothetical protein